ncbi:MAG: hypothetical protein AAF363_00900 [Bacteroidota bacterium]
MRSFLFTALLCSFFFSLKAQQATPDQIDSLKNQILKLSLEVDDINLRLDKTQRRFKMGMVISTVGYSTVIAGGQMLGRDNDGLGQALLYVGGTIGVIGTYYLVDSFRHLRAKRKKRSP